MSNLTLVLIRSSLFVTVAHPHKYCRRTNCRRTNHFLVPFAIFTSLRLRGSFIYLRGSAVIGAGYTTPLSIVRPRRFWIRKQVRLVVVSTWKAAVVGLVVGKAMPVPIWAVGQVVVRHGVFKRK